jgi:hypothetical protein
MYIVDHNNQSTGADELSLTAIAAELGRPKGADLTKFAQAHLDGIAADLNPRPRKRRNYATPDKVFDAPAGQSGQCGTCWKRLWCFLRNSNPSCLSSVA